MSEDLTYFNGQLLSEHTTSQLLYRPSTIRQCIAQRTDCITLIVTIGENLKNNRLFFGLRTEETVD